MDSVFTRVLWCALAVSVGGSLTPAAVAAQDLGQLFVQVVNQAGEAVTDLSLDEFEVTEGDVVCEIVSAELGADPMKIALLVDNSVLIHRANALTSLRAGLDGFLTALPEQHEVALATIGGNIRWRVDFTTDRDELRESAGEIFAVDGFGPILLDGIKETWERRFEDEESWPIFVVVATDGVESSANMNRNEYLRFGNGLISKGATVHVILLSDRTRRAAGGTPQLAGGNVTAYAISLTENTGGLYEVFGAGTRLATALPELGARLGTHYVPWPSRRTG